MAKRRDGKRKGGGGGGGLMSMRSGVQRLVGQGPKRKTSKTWNVISWLLVLALAGLAIYLFARRL